MSNCDTVIDKPRAYWVDFAKLMAILAVMLDHAHGPLYSNSRLQTVSFYSVSLFILIMGVTNYWTYNNYPINIFAKIKRGFWKIFRPYLVATILYSVLFDRQFFFHDFLQRLLHFSASGPFYYVLLYLQLLVLIPILFSILKFAEKKRYGIVIEVLVLSIIVIISSFTTNHTNILNVYGGGGVLFGGTYLILLYLGMLFGKYIMLFQKLSNNKIVVTLLFLVTATLTALWNCFIYADQLEIDSKIPFGMGFNPPSISFGLYAILMLLTIFYLEKVMSLNKISARLFKSISLLGRHTLYIFLYHRLFLDLLVPYFLAKTGITITSRWINGAMYFAFMICGSLFLELILEKLHIILSNIYTSNKRQHS